MSEPRCPSCDSSTLSVERRPDGDARCATCGWHGKYALCFDSKKVGRFLVNHTLNAFGLQSIQESRCRKARSIKDL